ncbi:MAG: TrmH family RNA methyltransferase [Actinomycetota bacterium]
MISSAGNPVIVRVRRLRKREWRERASRVLVEGARALEGAIRAGVTIDEVFYTSVASAGQTELLGRARGTGARLHEVTPGVMSHLTSVATAPGLLAVAEMRSVPLAALGPERSPGVLLGDVRDPATVGSILASAAATGARCALIAAGTADVFQPSAVRAGQGAHFHLAIVRGVAPGAGSDHMRANNIRVIELVEDGPAPWDVDLRGPILLAVGGRAGEGVSDMNPDARVAVPARAVTPSLSARAAVVLYEWVRQREA